MISAKEEPDASISSAMDGLLRIHKQLIGVKNDSGYATSGVQGTVITKLLIPEIQARALIGKQGTRIKPMVDASGCDIRVLGEEHLPPFALQDDKVVKIHGERDGVQKAVELIANVLCKFLVDCSIVVVFETKVVQIPLSYADSVIGTSSVNISYIHRSSGAAIEILETRDVPNEMSVKIIESASQVQAAEQLIQNIIAEASSAMQCPTGGSKSEV